jgi:hypothetical protein
VLAEFCDEDIAGDGLADAVRWVLTNKLHV